MPQAERSGARRGVALGARVRAVTAPRGKGFRCREDRREQSPRSSAPGCARCADACIRELHRGTVPAWAAADAFEAGERRRARIAAGATVVVVATGRNAFAVADDFTFSATQTAWAIAHPLETGEGRRAGIAA